MKDTTTLRQIIDDVLFIDVSPETKSTLHDFIQKWHKDKARSYVPEKREYAPKLTLINPDDPTHYNAIAFGQNEAIDQTLKAIDLATPQSKEGE